MVEEYEVAGVSNGIDFVDRSDAPSSPLPAAPIAWSLWGPSLPVLCAGSVAVVGSGAFREEVNGRRIAVCIEPDQWVSRGFLVFYNGGRLGISDIWLEVGKFITPAGDIGSIMKSSDINDISISYWSTGHHLSSL